MVCMKGTAWNESGKCFVTGCRHTHINQYKLKTHGKLVFSVRTNHCVCVSTLSGQWDILQADKSVFRPVQVSLLAQACFYFCAFIRLQLNGLHTGNVFEEAKISNQLLSSWLWLTCTTRTFVSLPFCTKTRHICVFACVFTYPWAAQLGAFVNRWRVVAFGCLAYVCIKVCAGGVFPLASLRQSESPRMTTSDWNWLKNCANVVECCHEWGINHWLALLTSCSILTQRSLRLFNGFPRAQLVNVTLCSSDQV